MPLVNEAVHHVVKCAGCGLYAPVTRSVNAQRWEGSIDVDRKQFAQRCHSLTNSIRLIVQVNAEERLADDALCQTHHLIEDIQGLTTRGFAMPAFEHGDCGPGHQCAKGRQVLAMEGRLDEAPLVQPG